MPKFPVGPTNSNPGPILFRVADTEVKVVTKSLPSRETKNIEITNSNKYVIKYEFVGDDKSFKILKGLRIKGNFALYSGKKILKEEFGEIQFTENALSGIPVLNVSHFANNTKNIFAVIEDYEVFASARYVKVSFVVKVTEVSRTKPSV